MVVVVVAVVVVSGWREHDVEAQVMKPKAGEWGTRTERRREPFSPKCLIPRCLLGSPILAGIHRSHLFQRSLRHRCPPSSANPVHSVYGVARPSARVFSSRGCAGLVGLRRVRAGGQGCCERRVCRVVASVGR